MVGTDRSVSLFDVAKRAKEMKARGEITETLNTKEQTQTPITYPNGCHLAEVEIDPDTGVVQIVSYAGIDDLAMCSTMSSSKVRCMAASFRASARC